MEPGDRPSTDRKSKDEIDDEKQKAQSERFIEIAKRLEADESGEAFDHAMRKIVKSRSSRGD